MWIWSTIYRNPEWFCLVTQKPNNGVSVLILTKRMNEKKSIWEIQIPCWGCFWCLFEIWFCWRGTGPFDRGVCYSTFYHCLQVFPRVSDQRSLVSGNCLWYQSYSRGLHSHLWSRGQAGFPGSPNWLEALGTWCRFTSLVGRGKFLHCIRQ